MEFVKNKLYPKEGKKILNLFYLMEITKKVKIKNHIDIVLFIHSFVRSFYFTA